MSQFHKMSLQKIQQVTDLYYEHIQECEKYWDRDNHQATKIQAKFRMYRLYKYYKRNRSAAITIQKYIRVYLALQVLFKKKTIMSNKQNEHYFGSQARVIQRYYKGFQKRKYFHDYYARKKYLTFLKNKNDLFKQDLDQNALNERNEEENRREKCAREEFLRLASNLHHLSSTNQQPGIYKPPYAPVAPKVFDIEIETHIKDAFKTAYKWKPPQSAKHRSISANRQEPTQTFKIRPGTQQVKRIK